MYNLVAFLLYPLYILFCFSLTVASCLYPFYYFLSDNIIMVSVVGFFMNFAKLCFVKVKPERAIRQEIEYDGEHCIIAEARFYTMPNMAGTEITFNGTFTANVPEEMYLNGFVPQNSKCPVKVYFKQSGKVVRLEKFSSLEDYEYITTLDTCPYRTPVDPFAATPSAIPAAVAAQEARCIVPAHTTLPIEIEMFEMSVASASRSSNSTGSGRVRKRHNIRK